MAMEPNLVPKIRKISEGKSKSLSLKMPYLILDLRITLFFRTEASIWKLRLTDAVL